MSHSFGRIVGAAAIALFAMGAQAHAGHGSSGGSWGSSGGSSGGYFSSGGSSGGYGSSGGGFSRWNSHRRVRVYSSHGSSGGSYGSHGSSSGSYGSYGSSGGSHGWHRAYRGWGSSGGSSGGVVYPHKGFIQKGGVIQKGSEVQKVSPDEGDDLVPEAVDSTQNRANTEATLTVNVAANARIFVNETPTRSGGTVRRYVSRGLMPGFEYTYEIRAELDRDGEAIQETKVVKVRGGESIDVVFDLKVAADLDTVVTVNVPADAKVFLAGHETSGQGPVRVFRTSKLRRGTEWSSYTICVSIERNGETVSREQSLTLKAGDTPSLTFDFDAPQVASR